jgi:phosphohistidine swiveling domain-containing protein
VAEELEQIVIGEIKKFKLPSGVIGEFFSLKKTTLLSKQRKESLDIKGKLERKNLWNRVKGLPVDKAMVLIKTKSPSIYEKILAHVNKYKWLGMMHFWGEPFNEEKFFSQIINAKNGLLEVKKTKLPEKLSRIKKQTQELSYWRQHIAETCAVASFAIAEKLEQISKKLGLSQRGALWLTPNEISRGLEGRLAISFDDIRKREAGFGLIAKDGSIDIILGEDLEGVITLVVDIAKKESIIKGLAASSGLAKGQVKILLSPEEISKIEKGDILVAPETTPDFLPAIYKSAAIVTDIGGITSHAAVTAREFGIPCVIGTKIATRVLKDGDLVEVDANRGVVKIIKRA